MESWQRTLNALVVYILAGILLAAFGVELFLHESPCPLCLLQRLGMLGVATSMLLNMQFGIRMSHYGFALLSSLVGGSVALRQISLHVCPDFPTFGEPLLGLNLYTWSFLVFCCVVLAVALLLFLYDPFESEPSAMGGWCWGAWSLIFLTAVGNILVTYFLCGFGPCEG